MTIETQTHLFNLLCKLRAPVLHTFQTINLIYLSSAVNIGILPVAQKLVQ